MSWTAILLLSAGCYLQKALGLLALGRASVDGRLRSLGALLPPALLAALVAIQTFSADGAFVFDGRVVGVAAGGLAAWKDAPFWLVIVIAAATAAGLRQFGL